MKRELSTKKTQSGRFEYFNVYSVRAINLRTREEENYGMYATKKAAEDAIQFIHEFLSDYYDSAYASEDKVWC